MAETRIGTSGWSYPGWNDRFYPADLPRRSVLAYLARRFNSVEINGSFYGLQKPQSYRKWHGETPEGFLFSLKGSRFITHNKKLRGQRTERRRRSSRTPRRGAGFGRNRHGAA